MRNWFWMWRKKAEFTVRRKDLVDSLPVDGVSGQVEWSQNGFLFSRRFNWEIREGVDGFELVEEAYISRSWYLLLVGAISCICTGYIGFHVLSGVWAVASVFGTFASLAVFAGSFLYLVFVESPVTELIESGRNFRYYMPVASPTIAIFPFFIVFLAASGIVQYLSLIGILVVFGVYAWFHDFCAEKSFQWQSKVVTRLHQIPLIAGNYVAGIGFSIVILLLFLLPVDEPVFLVLWTNWPFLVLLFYGLILFGLIELSRRTLNSGWKLETHGMQRGEQSTPHVLTVAVPVVAASMGFGYVVYLFLDVAVSFIRIFASVPAVGLVAITGLPVLYFAAGLCYQIGQFSHGMWELLRKAEPRELDHILEVDADTYVLDYSGIYAGAATLFSDYIVVSQGILDELSDEEMAAILAHEEGHLENRDSLLGVIVSVLSPLVLTGRNVLYAVLDFRGREFQADRYAVDRLNEQQVLDALDSLQLLKARRSTGKVPSVTPTLLSMDSTDEEENSVLDRWFGFYFGEFAMSEVHPGLDERKQKVSTK